MCDEWMRPVKLPISFDEFLRLPRNNAYKYEYFDGCAYLSPRPKFCHALLDLDAIAADPSCSTITQIRTRLLEEGDWEALVPVFAAAFERQLPFGGLTSEERNIAVRQSLERTRTGGDGPLMEAASFVAIDSQYDALLGAIFITMLPDADPSEWGSFHWRDPPPPDCIARRLGRPHVTWVFVNPWYAGQGAGTTLLTSAVCRLRELGFHVLASTFMPTNDSSVTWHWRNGFRLLEYPGSTRRLERRMRQE